MAEKGPATTKKGARTARKLTARGVKGVKHSGLESGGKARQEIAWDTEIPGLGLRAYPSGRRSWVLRYRFRGRQRIRVIGTYGVFSLEKARAKARALLVELDKQPGDDPLARPEVMPTVAEFAQDFLSHKASRVKASTLASYGTRLRHVERAFGHLGVDQVQDADVRRAFDYWTREIGPTAANGTVLLLRALLEFATSRGVRERSQPNPADAVERHKEVRRGRELKADELERIGRELVREEKERPDAVDTVAAIRLLILTGARRREVTGLTWQEVDLEGRRLRLDDSKTGPKEVPLSAPALQVLAGLPVAEDDDRVFPSSRHEVGYAVQYTWRRVRERAGCPDVRLHDLRHTYVTRGLSANFSATLVGKIVGHRTAASTRRYEHVPTDPLREAAESIASSLAADLEGKPKGAVVPIGEKR